MYIPKKFEMAGESAKISFMKRHSFACMVTFQQGRAVATHIPFVVQEEDTGLYLVSHMAKANLQTDDLHGQSCLVIFTGPHAYISPQHYERIESVPTWDYVAVHAYGMVAVCESIEEKIANVESMIDYYEPGYQAQWSGLSARFKAGMLAGLVAFRIAIHALEGQEKLSQNKSYTEQKRIENSLAGSDLHEEKALADYMKSYRAQQASNPDKDV